MGATTPSIVTEVTPERAVPVIVITVPPVVGPLAGLTPKGAIPTTVVGEAVGATVGVATKNVNVPVERTGPGPTPQVLAGWATVTVTEPVPAGATAVIVVSLTTATEVAGVMPNVTLVNPVAAAGVQLPWKAVPVIVTGVPPPAGPDDGATVVTAVTANADGTSSVATGSVSARIIRRADPSLMNLRPNIDSPLS
jgi:hypothetical protein